jgi:Phosphate-selective porin O and P
MFLLVSMLTRALVTSISDGGTLEVPPPMHEVAPATDQDLRAQLKLALEQLARHDKELEVLRKPAPPKPAETPWYEKLKLRGYTQLRYNFRGAVYNDKLINEQADRSLGGNGGFLIRRARLILFGDVHPRVSVYLQPDFASVIGEQLGVATLRDWYADIFLDDKKEFRFRVGQSKVPFGFENMQSSQNRLPLDRNDALNSALKDERDLGVFFYWAPSHIRARFKHLVDSGLKGSGDYGVIAFGAYNGQTANRIELNKVPHVVARATWPFALGNQFLEVGGGGYYGRSTITLGSRPDGAKVTSATEDNTFTDARANVSVVWYPKPFGISFEYNIGVGPQLGKVNNTLVNSNFLYGGYAQLMYKIDEPLGTVALIPFARGTMYDGGKKFVTNAPYYRVREVEFGVEWQVNKAVEVVLAYLVSDRTSDKTYASEYGHWGRVQLQFNY